MLRTLKKEQVKYCENTSKSLDSAWAFTKWVSWRQWHGSRVLLLSRFSRVQLSVTPWNCSPPGSSVHGVLQARILKWIANAFFRGSS